MKAGELALCVLHFSAFIVAGEREVKACSEIPGRQRRTATGSGDHRTARERVVSSLWRLRRGVYKTSARSNGTGVGVTVGGVPLPRGFPMVTVGQPSGCIRTRRCDRLNSHGAGRPDGRIAGLRDGGIAGRRDGGMTG